MDKLSIDENSLYYNHSDKSNLNLSDNRSKTSSSSATSIARRKISQQVIGTRKKQVSAIPSVKQFVAFMYSNKSNMSTEEVSFQLKDDYEKAATCGELVKKPTGIIFDDRMLLHECPWNSNHSENPKRYRITLERFKELKLIDRCKMLNYEMIDVSNITKLHTYELYKKLEDTSTLCNITEMEKIAMNYDAVYFNKETFNAAMISSSCAVQLIKEVCLGTVQNGMAIIRPPGHHAMKNDYCGFCFFNNVAIAAQYALDNNLAKKILIVDYDVHHGQGTQQMFYNSNKVLYFSIHRYENGEFWPNLRESEYDYIGEGEGEGHNVNFPLNAIGLVDADYLSITLHILLPLAYEFQPDLIIISAGYDACIGCFEGEMNITPGFYGHLITFLSGLAQSKLAVCLEGGYFAPSLAEGAAMTLKALLGDPTATLLPLSLPHDTTIATINNLKVVLRKYWNCFKMFPVYDSTLVPDCYQAFIRYFGEPLLAPFPTRAEYPEQGTNNIKTNTEIICNLKSEYGQLITNLPVCVCYDSLMLLHTSENARHFEIPERLHAIYVQYKFWKLDERCLNLEPTPVPVSILRRLHTDGYLNQILADEFDKIVDTSSDMYYDVNTKLSVLKAVDCILTVVDSVMKGQSISGAALIRPPGHHAEKDKPAGFCYLNNVAVAAQYILDEYKAQRILIVDFDIHHGNGTQAMFYDSKKVLYMSIHKHDCAKYFPNSLEGDYNKCGTGEGEGYNVNIAINGDSLCNIDYLTIFHRIILPIAYSYVPDVILISAGFDAGINDPLGNYQLTPDCFGHFIQMLKPLANGKLILALEGGYNITTLKYGMNICIKTLLSDPLPLLDLIPNAVKCSTIDCIDQVIAVQKVHWPILGIDKKLSALPPVTILT